MKGAIAFSLLLVTAFPFWSKLDEAREFLRQNQPEKASESIARLLAKTPNDPWLLYNAGIVAYAAKDFAKADSIWQQLASMELPEQLREQVWTQIGNVSFRLSEPLVNQQPDAAVAKLEQSREAYRVAIAQSKENRSEAPQKNLVFVEKHLERVYAQLAARLVEDSKKEEAPEPAINKLHAALDYQRNATALNPQEPQHAKAERVIEQLLAERFVEKAGQSEKQGDRIAEQKSLDQSKLDAAQQEFEKARADFKQAQVFDADKVEAKEGVQRVIEKLANMLAKEGRRELRVGNVEAKVAPDQAMATYEQSLDHFEQALAAKSDHKDALAGREEVKKAMEQLHLQQGDKLAKTGEDQLKKSPADATENLLGALDHYEQAKSLNPENPTIPPRIERVKKLLPEALMAMAQREQKQAAQAEPKSIPNAIAHLERAEAGYDKTLQLQSENQRAKDGLQQVQDDLARLRQQLAQQTTQSEQQQQSKEKGQGQEQQQRSFQEMLAEVKAHQSPNDGKARQRVGVKYDPSKNPGLKNW